MSFSRRNENILTTITNAVNVQFAAGYTIYVTPIGAIAAGSSSGSTITLKKVGSFRVGDKCLIDPGGLNSFTSAIDSMSVAGKTITFASETYAVSGGMSIVNLGPDSGTNNPSYANIPTTIWSDPGVTTISGSSLTSDSTGSYEYYHKGDGGFWELILDSGGAVQGVVRGFGGVPGRFNVWDYGAGVGLLTATIDDGPRIQAALDDISSTGGELHFPSYIYPTDTDITANSSDDIQYTWNGLAYIRVDNALGSTILGVSYAQNVKVAIQQLDAVETFASEDLTPSVDSGIYSTKPKIYQTANTTAERVVTNFDGGVQGQEIIVHITDAFTTISFNGSAFLAGNGGADLGFGAGAGKSQGALLRCTLIGTIWYCTVELNL